jgi:hypothetical protein
MFSSIMHLFRETRQLMRILAILGLLTAGGMATDASAGVVFQDSFNKGKITDRYTKHGGCYPYSFVQKNGVLWITNRFWEDNQTCSGWAGRKQNGSYYKRRAELMPKSKITQPAYDGEYEWEFDLKVAKAPKNRSAMIFQTNAAPYQGFDIGLRIENDQWVIKGGAKNVKARKTIGRVQRGKWMTVTVRFKRSMEKDGYVQLLINDDLKYNYRGPTTQSKSSQSTAKFGIYNGLPHNGTDRSEFIIEFDDLRIERHE